MLQLQSKGSLLAKLPLPWGCKSFKDVNNWMRPAHIMYANLLYLKSTDLNVSLI